MSPHVFPSVSHVFPFNAFVNEWVSRIESNILSRQLLKKGEVVLVGVSGGLDSMVLLRVLSMLAPRHGWKLRVAHFNHRLRGRSSDADEKLVRKVVAKLNLPLSVGVGDVRAFAETQKLSIEMAARQLRHEFFAVTAKANRAGKIALAHHADDQVELLFLRLQRGAGAEGLAGMKWMAPSPINAKLSLIRPLLSESREVLENFALQSKVAYREDASNASPDFLRNRIRQELIPILKRQNPPIFATALRSMEIIGAESDFVGQAATAWRQTRGTPFDELHISLQRRILHDELREMEVPVEFELVERLRRAPHERFSIGPKAIISRDHEGIIRVHNPPVEFKPGSLTVDISKAGQCEFGSLRLYWSTHRHSGGSIARAAGSEFFDTAKLGRRVCLRYWQPGDRFQPIGMRSEVKLQDLFVNLKVSAEARRHKVVALAESGEIFWVEGVRISEKFKVEASTVRKLKWSWKTP